MNDKLNIYQKIQAIANKLLSIEKDMKIGVGQYQYKAVSDLSVTKAVKEAEKEFGVVSIPVRQELVSQETIKTQDGDRVKTTFSFIIKMTIAFINLDNVSERIEVESFGHGLDTGDKGFGKASTYARKYALLNAYKIATGEDPDQMPNVNQKGKLTKSEKRIAVENFLTKNENHRENVLHHFSAGSIDDLTDQNIETIYTTYKTRGMI